MKLINLSKVTLEWENHQKVTLTGKEASLAGRALFKDTSHVTKKQPTLSLFERIKQFIKGV